ncbi:1-acyl-sn-glycerol-3-phosphate acyltransferase [Alteromonadaceae bacterium 2753L.S.0a.02]|nr:1-acyl-sn-glycerol-3-phosphate acyltransferase [Alteromonadaceae bacterium 2753L.S.0a.02]
MNRPDTSGCDLYPAIPDEMPRAGGPLRCWIGRQLMRLLGWRLEGEFPKEKQLVLAAAPHTSNWDFILAMLLVMMLGVRISYLMKKEAFFWPLGGLFMKLGGIPINRKAAEDIVGQVASWYQQHEKVWVVITPEGTRSKVKKWKTGFLRIAERAQVPVCIVGWDYPSKTMHIGPLWQLTGDHEADAENIRSYIAKHYTARYPDKQ